MAPRFQCLRAVQNVTKNPQYARATFSTTMKSMADILSSSSDLANIDRRASPHPAARVGIPIPSATFPAAARSRDERPGPLGLAGLRKSALEHRQAAQEKQTGERERTLEERRRQREAETLTRQIRRKWRVGDVYAPHDLSPQEMKKWKTRRTPTYDVFDLLRMNPLEEYKNFSIMSEFMTPLGRIMHSKETGLRPVNQRKIAKAIRRSIGMGIMPSVHRHPELLMRENARKAKEQLSPAKMV